MGIVLDSIKLILFMALAISSDLFSLVTEFETKNKYSINDALGRQLYWAAEESSFLARNFLKKLRPFTMHIGSTQSNVILKLSRPFRFFLHEIHILDSAGRELGMIKQRFSLFSKKFDVKDSTGREIYKIYEIEPYG